MKSRLSLGLSNARTSEFHSSLWERLWKICLFATVCALLAIFFAYLTGQVQIGTAHATRSDQQDTTSQ